MGHRLFCFFAKPKHVFALPRHPKPAHGYRLCRLDGHRCAGTVLVGIFFFKEPTNFWRIFFILTLIGSVSEVEVSRGVKFLVFSFELASILENVEF